MSVSSPAPALVIDGGTLDLAGLEAVARDGREVVLSEAARAAVVNAVSIRLSPFTTLLVGTEKFMTSVLSLFAASSKDVLVRVDGSKKRYYGCFTP